MDKCIECHEGVEYKGQTWIPDTEKDGTEVYVCYNPDCKRYGLLNTLTE